MTMTRTTIEEDKEEELFSVFLGLFSAKKEGEKSTSFLIHRTISGTLALSTLLAYINFYNLFGLLQNEGKK